MEERINYKLFRSSHRRSQSCTSHARLNFQKVHGRSCSTDVGLFRTTSQAKLHKEPHPEFDWFVEHLQHTKDTFTVA